MTFISVTSPLARAAVGLVAALALALPSDRLSAAGGRAPAQAAAAAGLRIVVIAGEDAVNVIQQKTAVAPIVEVRDKNDQPVAGVLVRFVVRGGKGATLNGQTALTVTTNTAGRAAVPAFNPTVAGTLEIDVTASSGGQIANTTIRQRTFQTAADAAKAGQNSSTNSTNSTSSTSSTPGASGGAAAGGGSAGGGIGAGTIAIGVVGAGAGIFALTKIGGGDNGGGGSSGGGSTGGGTSGGGTGGGGTGGGGTGTTQNLTVSGPFTLTTPITWTYVGGVGTCTYTDTTTGTIRLTLQVQPSGAVTGTSDTTASSTISALTCSFGQPIPPPGGSSNPPATLSTPVSGTASNLTFTHTYDVADPQFTYAYRMIFTGALANGVVTGTLRETNDWTAPGIISSWNGSSSTQVTLR